MFRISFQNGSLSHLPVDGVSESQYGRARERVATSSYRSEVQVPSAAVPRRGVTNVTGRLDGQIDVLVNYSITQLIHSSECHNAPDILIENCA